jgi:DNA-binding XRE family transcriptional regulator
VRRAGGALVDLVAVRASMARLDALALAHPDRLGPSTPANARALETDLMPKTKQYAFRLPESLIAELDVIARELSKARPGLLEVGRSEALRVLLHEALTARGRQPAAHEAPKARPAPARAPAVQPDPDPTLPRRMKAWREAHGLTVRDAGTRAGVSHATWARIERGDFAGRANTLDAIRRAVES